MPALVSFKLRAVHQEERKKITLIYDRSEATQRTYAPQGFFGVLVADLDKRRHFIEVDLDDPFFRVFQVIVEPPEDFGQIGLRSAQVALDYGAADDPATIKHNDMVFDPYHPDSHSFEVFVNSRPHPD